MDRLVGEVLTYKQGAGYCFLVGSDGRSHFLHVRNIRDSIVPSVGDLFSFSLRESLNKPGKQEAFDAELVKRRSTKPRVAAPATEAR
jgi:hypothetical protein